MKSTPTPGPWFTDTMFPCLVRTRDTHVAQTTPYACTSLNLKLELTEEVREANARLIAAAPDMIETLEVINRLLDDDHSPNARKLMSSLITPVIAKARGES